MPVSVRNYLANKLRDNWMALEPSDGNANDIDDSLTNLDWLQNIGNKSWTTINTNRKMQVNPNKILNIRTVNVQERTSEYSSPCSPVSNINQLDYSTNRDVKPPHSYAALIFMAIEAADRRKLTLSSIYDWIKQNFPYYNDAACGWRNSIRHTLTINKCFVKVPRNNDEPGKGSFWRINPTYSHLVKTGSFKRKIYSDNLSPSAKRFRGQSCENTRNIKQLKLDGNDPCLTSPPSHVDNNAIPFSDLGSFLNQDIEIDGIKIKTEQLIDSSDDDGDFPSMPSPPVSSVDIENLGIDEYFASFTSSLHHDDSVDTSLNSSNTSFGDSDSCDAEINLKSWWNDVSIDSKNEKPTINSTRNTEFKLNAKPTDDSSYEESSDDFTWLRDITATFDLSDIFNS